MMKRFIVVMFGMFLLVSGVTAANAASITYTFAATGTGDLNGIPFTDAAFTITAVGDTANIVNCVAGVFCNANTSATVAITGFTTATFITATQIFDNQGSSALGFERAPNGIDLLDISDPAFATYDLSTSIGPIFVATAFAVNQFNCNFGCVVTSQGNLDFSSITNVTFTASTVPEPGSIALLGSGLLGVAGVLRRKLMR